ncbi:MAG: hypothetical protein QXL51_07795 [Candidatus Aenigmatarchaeota archaeon]
MFFFTLLRTFGFMVAIEHGKLLLVERYKEEIWKEGKDVRMKNAKMKYARGKEGKKEE